MAVNRASPESLLLRVSEAAEMCGIGRSLLYQMISAGQIPTVTCGKRACRIPRQWLEAWISGQVTTWEVANRAREGR